MSRLWRHVRREPDTPLWRHGAAFVTVFRGGLRNRPYTDQRLDLTASAEWTVFGRGHGFGAESKFGAAGSEHDHSLSLHLGRLGSLWLHAGGYWPHRWKPEGYEDREVGVRFHDGMLVVDIWAPWGRHTKADPWYRTSHIISSRHVLGRTLVTSTTVDSGTTTVPLPEANYPATWETTRHEQRYSAPIGRLRDRVLGARVHYRTEVRPGVPPAIPGKGESAWDCGDDHISASSSPGRSVERAVAGLVESVLDRRARYGGRHMSVPRSAP